MSNRIKEIRYVPNGRSRRMAKLKPLLLAIISALVGSSLSLAFAPYSMWYIMVPCLLWLVFFLDHFKTKDSVWYSFFYMLGFWGSSIYWIFYSIYNYGNAGAVISALMIALLSLAMAALFALLARLYLAFTANTGLFGYIAQPTSLKVLMFGALWAMYEGLRELLTFPWLGLGNVAIDAPSFLSNWLPLIGANGTSILIAMTCSAAYFTAKAVVRKLLHDAPLLSARQSTLILLVVLLATAGTFFIPEMTSHNKKKLTVGLVQPNIPLSKKWNGNYTFSNIEKLFYLSKPLSKKVDLIIWPESAVASIYQRFNSLLTNIKTKLSPARLLTGSLRRNRKTGGTHNSIFLEGKSKQQVYDKQTLVPYGEFIPFVNQLKFLIQLIGLPELGLTVGPLANGIMNIDYFRLSSSICYEITFAHNIATEAINSDAILTISDDGWFGKTIGPAQHYQMARVRAKENGRYLVRVANDGTTSIVDNFGVEVSSLARFTQGTLVAEVPGYSGRTIYSIISGWLRLPVILLAVLLCWAYHFLNRKNINS